MLQACAGVWIYGPCTCLVLPWEAESLWRRDRQPPVPSPRATGGLRFSSFCNRWVQLGICVCTWREDTKGKAFLSIPLGRDLEAPFFWERISNSVKQGTKPDPKEEGWLERKTSPRIKAWFTQFSSQPGTRG